MQQITYVKNETVTIAYLGNVMDNRFNEHVVSKEIAKKNGEVWTPRELVESMINQFPKELWTNPEEQYLDPTMGSGNMIICMLEKRIASGIEPVTALKTLFGVELMQDNVDVCKDRIRDVLRSNKVKITEKINEIIDHNFVCADFFKWDFDNWCPKEESTEESGIDQFLVYDQPVMYNRPILPF